MQEDETESSSGCKQQLGSPLTMLDGIIPGKWKKQRL
jgi:hypothetical protein